MKKPSKITHGKSNPTKQEKPPHVSKIEILTVWAEYLKRSEGYKEFVAAVRDRGEPPEFVAGSLTKFKKNYEQFGDIFAKGFSVKAIADRFSFGDEPFDEKQYLNLFIRSLKNKLDREPTVKDLIKLLTQDLEKSPLLFLIIDIQGKTDEELKAAFLDEVKAQREAVEKEKAAYIKRMESRMGDKFVNDMRQTWEPVSISKKPRGIPFKRPSTGYFRKVWKN